MRILSADYGKDKSSRGRSRFKTRSMSSVRSTWKCYKCSKDIHYKKDCVSKVVVKINRLMKEILP